MFAHSSSRRWRAAATALLVPTLALAALVGVGAPSPASAHGSLGTLTAGDRPVFVAEAGDYVYVTNYLDGTVSVYDPSNWSPVTTIAVGSGPGFVVSSPDGSEAWVANYLGGSVSVIDTSTNVVTSTITVGGAPYSLVFTGDATTVYALNTGLQKVQAIEVATETVTPIGTGLGEMTYGVLSTNEAELYYVGTNFDRFIGVSLADGSYDFNSRPAYPVSATVAAMTPTPDGSELWVSLNGGSGEDIIAIYDSTGTTLLDTIVLPDYAAGIAFDPTGQRAFATIFNDGTVEMIDVASRESIASIVVGNEPRGVLALSTTRIAVTNQLDDELELIGFDQERLAGANRYETGVEISQRAFPSGASTVFVASGTTFPDALAAGPAAGTLGASLLLTAPTALPTAVRDEIIRLNPDTIYLVGGTGAVSTAVENALKVIQPNTIRLSGANRYATGAAIVDEVWSSTVPEVFIATGRNYPDALSAGAVAAGQGIPVILVDGSAATVPPSTIAQITALAPTRITIAGGTGAVSAGIAAQLSTEFGGGVVRRLAGADRYATSAAINLDAYPTNTGVIYATGTGFADALAGAALAGRAQIPVYLVKPSCVPAAGIDAVYAGQATALFLLGGTGALTTAVENLTACP